MALPVTALYAGLMGLWLLALGIFVVRLRRRHDVSTGDGGVRALGLAMRAHGNASESIPIALILLGLAEGMGAPSWLLHGFGAMLVTGRLLHGGYFLTGARRLNIRVLGMILTWGMIGVLALGVTFRALAKIG